MPLDIIIVKAGIAGVTAAVSLRQDGPSIITYEKSKFATKVNAALLLSSNGARALSRLGFSIEPARGRQITAWDTLDGTTLSNIGRLDLEDAEKRYGAPLISVHRVDLHKELVRLASTDDGSNGGGEEVSLVLDSRVVGANAEEGSIELVGGSVKKANLLVAGDGVRSVLRSVVLGQEAPKAMMTGLSAFWVLIQTSGFAR